MPLTDAEKKLLGVTVTFDSPTTPEAKEDFAKDIGRIEPVDSLDKITKAIQKITKSPLQVASEKVTELARGRVVSDIPTKHKGSHLSDEDNAYWDAVATLNKLYHDSKV